MDLLDNLSTVLHQSAEKVVLVDLSDLSHFIEAGGGGGGDQAGTSSVSLPEYSGGSGLAVIVHLISEIRNS